jgi:hypothetical protein
MDCDAAAICRRSFDVAAKVARASYGIVPQLIIHASQNCKFSYVRARWRRAIPQHAPCPLSELFGRGLTPTEPCLPA